MPPPSPSSTSLPTVGRFNITGHRPFPSAQQRAAGAGINAIRARANLPSAPPSDSGSTPAQSVRLPPVTSLLPMVPENAQALARFRSGELSRPAFDLQNYLIFVTGWSPTIDAFNKASLANWLNQEFRGASFELASARAALDVGKTVNNLRKKVKEINEKPDVSASDKERAAQLDILLRPANVANLTPTKRANLSELFTEISGMSRTTLMAISSGVSEISDIAEAVVTSIPFLGSIISAVKLVIQGFKLGKLIYEMAQIKKIQETSFSVLESLTTSAILVHQEEKAILSGEDLAGSGLSSLASLAGLGVFASIGKYLVMTVTKVVLQILRLLEVRQLNSALQTGTVTPELLADTTLLSLHLPHLRGADTLTILGVLPPGWRRDGDMASKIQDALNTIAAIPEDDTIANRSDVAVLIGALHWEQPTMYRPATASKPKSAYPLQPAPAMPATNGWHAEYKRVLKVLEESDKYLHPQIWRLYQNATVLHEPGDPGMMATTKRQAIRVFGRG